jgi:hypothetical protein
MKQLIPRDYLLAFARECLKLEQLLSEPDDLAELGKFLNLIRSIEKSGGISALEALLHPEHTDWAGLSTAWDSAISAGARKPVPPQKHPSAASCPLTGMPHTKETP